MFLLLIPWRLALPHLLVFVLAGLGQGHLMTGPTGTNVMDVAVILVGSPSPVIESTPNSANGTSEIAS
jgi:hypothetical protein